MLAWLAGGHKILSCAVQYSTRVHQNGLHDTACTAAAIPRLHTLTTLVELHLATGSRAAVLYLIKHICWVILHQGTVTLDACIIETKVQPAILFAYAVHQCLHFCFIADVSCKACAAIISSDSCRSNMPCDIWCMDLQDTQRAVTINSRGAV